MLYGEFAKTYMPALLYGICVNIILCSVIGGLLISGISDKFVNMGAILLGIGLGFPICSVGITFLVNLKCSQMDGAA